MIKIYMNYLYIIISQNHRNRITININTCQLTYYLTKPIPVTKVPTTTYFIYYTYTLSAVLFVGIPTKYYEWPGFWCYLQLAT